MGWTHSVGVAQAAHEHQIQLSGCFEPTDHITADSDPMLDRTRHGVYIDDTCVLTPDLADGEKGMQEYQRHMESIGLPHKVSKFVQLTTDPVEVLGMEVSRDRHAPSVPKLEALCRKTMALVQVGSCTGRQMEELLGEWTWPIMVRRPLLAVFSAVYVFSRKAGPSCLQLWPSVRRELRMIVALVPLLYSVPSATFSDRAVASDASTTGLGVCATKLNPKLAAKVSIRFAAVLKDAESDTTDSCAAEKGLKSLVASVPWYDIVATPVQFEEHINVLELRALVLALRWYLSLWRPPDPVRLLSVVDSSVAYFAVNKGRSSSAPILRVLRSLSALLLAGGVFLRCGWVPSHLNPADAPSRLF